MRRETPSERMRRRICKCGHPRTMHAGPTEKYPGGPCFPNHAKNSCPCEKFDLSHEVPRA